MSNKPVTDGALQALEELRAEVERLTEEAVQREQRIGDLERMLRNAQRLTDHAQTNCAIAREKQLQLEADHAALLRAVGNKLGVARKPLTQALAKALWEQAEAENAEGERTSMALAFGRTVLRECASEPAQEAPDVEALKAEVELLRELIAQSNKRAFKAMTEAPAPSAIDAELFEALEADANESRSIDGGRALIDEFSWASTGCRSSARALRAWYDNFKELRRSDAAEATEGDVAKPPAIAQNHNAPAVGGEAGTSDPIRERLVAERDAAWDKDGFVPLSDGVMREYVEELIRKLKDDPHSARLARAYRAELALREYDEAKAKAKELEPVESFPMPTVSEAHASGWDVGFDAGVHSVADNPVTKAALELAASMATYYVRLDDAQLRDRANDAKSVPVWEAFVAYRRAVRARDEAGKLERGEQEAR